MPKYCSFCGQTNTPTDDEHVIPKWMALLYPDIDWAIQNSLTKYVRKSTRYVHLTVPICRPCNGGWMSQLEKRTKPILVPMIEGNRVVLSPHDQGILKSWLCLRAMIYDLHTEKYAPPPHPRYFLNEEHRKLATSFNCHPYYQFFLGRYKGERLGLTQEDHFGTPLMPLKWRGQIDRSVRGYSMTFVFKYLVLQMLCVNTDPLVNVPDIEAWCFKFGEDFAINSYPPLRFRDKGIDHFVHRWSKYVEMASVVPLDTPESTP